MDRAALSPAAPTPGRVNLRRSPAGAVPNSGVRRRRMLSRGRTRVGTSPSRRMALAASEAAACAMELAGLPQTPATGARIGLPAGWRPGPPMRQNRLGLARWATEPAKRAPRPQLSQGAAGGHPRPLPALLAALEAAAPPGPAEVLRSVSARSRLAEPEGFEPSIRLWSV
jgi:hypothetical protein